MRTIYAYLFSLVMLVGSEQGSFAAIATALEGQSFGNTNWIPAQNGTSQKLDGWQELDYVPLRVVITGGPASNQTFTVTFEHLSGAGGPALEGFFNFTTSPNVILTSTNLNAPVGVATWSYSFTVTVTDTNTGTVNFFTRLSAGSNAASTTDLKVSLGTKNLTIFKPNVNGGSPDLSLVKSGPASVNSGAVINYSITYSNAVVGSDASGVQITDTLPPAGTLVSSSLPYNLLGSTVIWDLPNVGRGGSGVINFSCLLATNLLAGSNIVNSASIASSSADPNPTNNTSTTTAVVAVGCIPVTISGQPLSVTTCSALPVTFSVAANGTAPLAYIWRKDGTNIAGATQSSYTISSVATNDAGSYTVIVTNSCSSQTATSAVAALTVNLGTTATALTSLTVCSGQPATFSTTVSGSGPFTYVWKKDGVAQGSATNTLSIASAVLTNAGTYTVEVSGACNTITNSATLAVSNVTAANGPTNQTACQGSLVTLATTASGAGPFSYVWKKNNVIQSSTSNVLNIASTDLTDAGTYVVEITGACSSVTNSATVTVLTNTSATALSSLINCPNTPATFSTTASGTGPFSYVWKKDSISILGATNNSYSISNITSLDAATYTVEVNGFCNSVTNSATLTVLTNITSSTLSNVTICAGSPADFSTTPTGTGPYDYVWTLDGNVIGTNGPDLTIPTLSFTNGNYIVEVKVAGACGSATNSAILTVNSLIGATGLNPVTICQGGSTNFSVTASGTGPFSYFWTLDGNSIPTNSPIISVATGALSLGNHDVQVVVTGTCGSATNATTLTVNPAPTYPVSGPTLVCPNSLSNLFDGPSGTFSFTWSVTGNGAIISGTNGQSVAVDALSAGSFTLSLLVIDTNGCSSISQTVVAVGDTNAPTITCPTNLVLTADVGSCGRSNVTFSVTALDNCLVTNLVSTPASGSTFPIGVTTVTSVATDASGNTNSCTFTVTVNDTQAPTISCPTNLVLTADAGQCGRSNVTFLVSASDNCSVTNLVSTPASGSTFPIGVTTVTSIATDASGNTNSCTFTVTVNDTPAPTISCPTNLVLTADAGQCGRSNVTFLVSASDNCSVTNLVFTPASGSTFPIGVTTVTSVATDASGNTNSCTFTVTVNDTQAPTISCPTNLVLTADAGSCGRSNVTFSVSASDNCAVTNLVSTPASGSTFPIGVTTVTSIATDASGNTNSCTFTVTVNDTQAPTISCPTNLVLTADAGSCGRSNVTFSVTALDNCSVTNLVSTPASGSTFPIGVTTVTSVATDASGNTNRCTFTVTVNDTQAPTIFCPTNLVLTADAGQCGRSNVTFLGSSTFVVGS